MKSFALAAVAAALAAAPLAAGTGSLQFAPAVSAARSAGTAAGYARSAELLLVDAAYHETSKSEALAKLEAAIADADKGLALDAGSSDARLQKAIALGYRGKITKSRGDAKAAEEMIEAVIKRDPKNAMAYAALGGLHGEAVSNLGKFLAGTMMGSSAEKSMRAFQTATELAPTDMTIRALYAVNVIAMKQMDQKARVKALLTPVVKAPAKGEMGAVMKATARDMLAALNAGDDHTLKRIAWKARPFDRFV